MAEEWFAGNTKLRAFASIPEPFLVKGSSVFCAGCTFLPPYCLSCCGLGFSMASKLGELEWNFLLQSQVHEALPWTRQSILAFVAQHLEA